MSYPIYPTEFYYKILDHLPEIPNELLTSEEFYDLLKKPCTLKQFPSKGGFIRPDGFDHKPSIWSKNIPNDLLSWVNKNIRPSTGTELMMYRRIDKEPTKNFYPPHTDHHRHFTLIYNIVDSGGENIFWQQKDQPVFRELGLGDIKDYNSLIELCRFPSPYKKWYLLNNQVIHGVENIIHVRESIQIECKITDQLVIDYLKPLV